MSPGWSRKANTVRCSGRSVANALKEDHVGLEENDDDVWSLYFGQVLLGKIDVATMKVCG
jgi:hypothetical protein